jgi:acetate---CoA ligase (ADP-forming)
MNVKLKNFFYPSSICIAGASTKEKSIGYELLKSIKKFGYKGHVYPVNPKADEILGFKNYKSIGLIPFKVDLAIVVVPKRFVEETVDQLLNKGVQSIILVTAGFKETGKAGAEAEKIIFTKIKNASARLVGPNCMGVITTFNKVKLNATFVAEEPKIGKTAFLSQSGAIGAAILNSLRETDIRFGHFISVGNKADISENDLLLFWQEDENILTITLYLESFVDGEAFIKPFIENKINKPVIILKAGRTKEGIQAASSHTGAIGSSDKVVDSVLDQFGIIRVDTLTELFNTSKGFENFIHPKGNKIAVITNAGGPAILAVDSIGKENLTLADLSAKTKEKLKQIVHPEGSVQNPVDLLPGGTAEQFKLVNEIVASDKNVDAVISVFVEPVMVPAFEVIENINSIKSEKPIYQVVMPLPEFWENYRLNSKYKKPLFKNPEEPAKVISNILFHSKKSIKQKYLQPDKIKTNITGETGILSNKKTDSLLKKYNFPVINSQLLKPDEFESEAIKIKYPLVLKGISEPVIHKSEFNAVKLNLENFDELLSAKKLIEESFNKHKLNCERFLIQPFVKAKHELLLGGFRDPTFGPMIMFGSGGKYVEVFNDTSMKSAYMCETDADEIIDRTKIGKILKGVRGEEAVNINELKKIILSAGQMMLDNSNITEFDFNPLIVLYDNSFSIVDARIKIE